MCAVSQNKDGGFLVRDSSRSGKYTVSLFSKVVGWVSSVTQLPGANSVFKRRVWDECRRRGPQIEKKYVNYSCKTWSNLPAGSVIYPSAISCILTNKGHVSCSWVMKSWLTLSMLSTEKQVEAADIITSAPLHRDIFTWLRSIISAPSPSSSTITSTMQQVNVSNGSHGFVSL